MKHVHKFQSTRFALIAVVPLLFTVPLPAGAEEIHGDSHDRPQQTHNTSLGRNSLGWLPASSGSLTRGVKNTAIGSNALQRNLTGSYNTAVGASALPMNSTGKDNTAIGYKTLYRSTTGGANTAIGSEALPENQTGGANTAIGYKTLHQNRNGSNNTAVGWLALQKNNTGSKNTGLGFEALRDNKTGKYNTGLGARAGCFTNGSRNIFLGYRAGCSSDYSKVSNKLVIANGKERTDKLITGDFSTDKVTIHGDIHASGVLTHSDGRLKKDIKPLTHALDSILQLEGKTYRWKEDTTFANKKDIGLVAQEVERIFPELVAEDEKGYKGIAYSKLTAVLIEAIKEQQGQMVSQQQQMTEQETRFTAEITALQDENTQLKALVEGQMEALLARVAMLEGETLAAN